MGQPPPRDMPKGKAGLIVEFPCDGVARFEVRGSQMAFKVPYSVAYGEVFRLAGGTIEPGKAADSKPTRVFTVEAVRRITALNRLYRPHAVKQIAALKAAQDLLAKPAPAATVHADEPIPHVLRDPPA